jgi:hypothetical protein
MKVPGFGGRKSASHKNIQLFQLENAHKCRASPVLIFPQKTLLSSEKKTRVRSSAINPRGKIVFLFNINLPFFSSFGE